MSFPWFNSLHQITSRALQDADRRSKQFNEFNVRWKFAHGMPERDCNDKFQPRKPRKLLKGLKGVRESDDSSSMQFHTTSPRSAQSASR